MLYWVIGCLLISSIYSDRFKQMNAYLHINPSENVASNQYYKIRPLINYLRTKLKEEERDLGDGFHVVENDLGDDRDEDEEKEGGEEVGEEVHNLVLRLARSLPRVQTTWKLFLDSISRPYVHPSSS